MFAPCPNCHSFPCHYLVGTRLPGSPHHLLHAPATLPLHWYLHELPEPICCHGIIFEFVAVAPLFVSATMTKCFIMLLSTFSLKLHNLEHVLHIMIITFKCLKLLLHQIDKCIWGFTGFIVCYIRLHLNCLDCVVYFCSTSCHVNQHLILLSSFNESELNN